MTLVPLAAEELLENPLFLSLATLWVLFVAAFFSVPFDDFAETPSEAVENTANANAKASRFFGFNLIIIESPFLIFVYLYI